MTVLFSYFVPFVHIWLALSLLESCHCSTSFFSVYEKGGKVLIDDQYVDIPLLTHENLKALAEQPTNSSIGPPSELNANETDKWDSVTKQAHVLKSSAIASDSLDTGTTSSETNSAPLTDQNEPLKSVSDSDSNAFTAMFRSSSVFTTLLPFFDEKDLAALRPVCRQINESIDAAPGHRLAAVMPSISGLFLPHNSINDRLASFFRRMKELDSGLFAKYDSLVRVRGALKPTSVFPETSSRTENAARAFDNLKTFLWFLKSHSRTLSLPVRVRFASLISFLKQNDYELAVNVLNSFRPLVTFAPELVPASSNDGGCGCGPLAELKSVSKDEWFEAFYDAVCAGNVTDFLSLARGLLQVHGAHCLVQLVYFKHSSRNGWTLLHVAALRNFPALIELLAVGLLNRFDLYDAIAKEASDEGFVRMKSCLFSMTSSEENKKKVMSWFYETIFNKENAKVKAASIPLIVAIRQGLPEATQTLLRLQSELLKDTRCEYWSCALHIAAVSRSLAVLKLVLGAIEARSLPSILKFYGLAEMCPLEVCLHSDWQEGFEHLLALDRKQINFRHPVQRRYPIHLAAQYASEALFDRVVRLSAPALSRRPDANNDTPLVIALRARRFVNAHRLWFQPYDSLAVFRLLSDEKGGSGSRSDNLALLQQFFECYNIDVDKFLLEAPLLMGNVTLMAALILSRNVAGLRWFLSKASPRAVGTLLRKPDVAGNYPIHLAVLSGDVEAFEYLLRVSEIAVPEQFRNRAGLSLLSMINLQPLEKRQRFLSVLKMASTM